MGWLGVGASGSAGKSDVEPQLTHEKKGAMDAWSNTGNVRMRTDQTQTWNRVL